MGDGDLIAAVRAGDTTAFGVLYARHRPRVGNFAARMVHDHARAEDITQEVFISALRRIRATDAEIAFVPWVLEITRNACIDHARRARRGREVPLTLDGESDSDATSQRATRPQLQLVSPPDAEAEQRQSLADLCGAFGGLSEAQHRMLVMRELEGRPYTEIAAAFGVTEAVVESALFRARRKLTDEFSEITSGRRCLAVHALVEQRTAATGRAARLGVKDGRLLRRHLAHCRPCRRHAAAVGFDLEGLVPRGAAARIAALLPVPWLWRLTEGRRIAAPSPTSPDLVGLLPVAEAAGSGAGRLAAAAIAVVVAGGTGVVAEQAVQHRSSAATAGSEIRPRVAAGAAGAVGAQRGGVVSARGVATGRPVPAAVGHAGGQTSGAANAARPPGTGAAAAGRSASVRQGTNSVTASATAGSTGAARRSVGATGVQLGPGPGTAVGGSRPDPAAATTSAQRTVGSVPPPGAADPLPGLTVQPPSTPAPPASSDPAALAPGGAATPAPPAPPVGAPATASPPLPAAPGAISGKPGAMGDVRGDARSAAQGAAESAGSVGQAAGALSAPGAATEELAGGH